MTHGNGPQVGVLALQSASDPHLTTPYPFDVLGAQTQGMIGYWLLQAMQNRSRPAGRGDHQPDPGRGGRPRLPGPDQVRRRGLHSRRGGRSRAARLGGEADGDRLAPRGRLAPPQRVVETRLIRLLLESGAVVVCAGGGGVPVIRDEHGLPRRRGGRRRQGPHQGGAGRGPRGRPAARPHRRAERRPRLRYDVRRAHPACHSGHAAARELPGGVDGSEGRGRLPLRRAHGRHRRHRRLEDAVAITRGLAGTIVTPSKLLRRAGTFALAAAADALP